MAPKHKLSLSGGKGKSKHAPSKIEVSNFDDYGVSAVEVLACLTRWDHEVTLLSKQDFANLKNEIRDDPALSPALKKTLLGLKDQELANLFE